ncbi:hypothetical protein PFFCH_03918 [Plasmodium falciparum FCH/4]|uniref:Uncharacterized protein n=1 Tax=Plasmodium falciparum FCH/4 TaxID=1036724 RepID=A0A024VJ57_PLAFA|nr:hypothetical protein PFFCH_03918 [Plasmodium falciparum FCH/4]
MNNVGLGLYVKMYFLYVSLLNRDQLAKGSYYSDCKTDYVRSYAKDLKKSEVTIIYIYIK